MRGLVVALWISVALIVVYWTIWFIDRPLVASFDSASYYAFEDAFPLADAWLGIAAALAAIAITRDHRSKAFWLIVTGSAAAYLTAMDVTYDLENRVYTTGSGSGAITESLINLASLALAIWTLRVGWRLLQDPVA